MADPLPEPWRLCRSGALVRLPHLAFPLRPLSDPDRQKEKEALRQHRPFLDRLHLVVLTVIFTMVGHRVAALIVLEFSLRAVSTILSLNKVARLLPASASGPGEGGVGRTQGRSEWGGKGGRRKKIVPMPASGPLDWHRIPAQESNASTPPPCFCQEAADGSLAFCPPLLEWWGRDNLRLHQPHSP